MASDINLPLLAIFPSATSALSATDHRPPVISTKRPLLLPSNTSHHRSMFFLTGEALSSWVPTSTSSAADHRPLLLCQRTPVAPLPSLAPTRLPADPTLVAPTLLSTNTSHRRCYSTGRPQSPLPFSHVHTSTNGPIVVAPPLASTRFLSCRASADGPAVFLPHLTSDIRRWFFFVLFTPHITRRSKNWNLRRVPSSTTNLSVLLSWPFSVVSAMRDSSLAVWSVYILNILSSLTFHSSITIFIRNNYLIYIHKYCNSKPFQIM